MSPNIHESSGSNHSSDALCSPFCVLSQDLIHFAQKCMNIGLAVSYWSAGQTRVPDSVFVSFPAQRAGAEGHWLLV